MAFDKFGGPHAFRQARQSELNTQYLTEGFSRRIYDIGHFYIRSLWVLPVWLYVTIIRLFTDAYGKRLGLWFSRLILKRYFANNGVDAGWVNPKAPRSFDKATLILALRDEDMSSHFIHTLFTGTLILPMKDYMKNFGTLPLPLNTLGSLMSECTYVDQPLGIAHENVRTLLKKGYPTLAYINRDFAHSSLNNVLRVYKSLLELTQMPGVDVYLLSTSGISNIHTSTRHHTCLIANKLYPLSDILSGRDLNSVEGINRFGEFFGFRYIEMLS
jgi:hypothetical protein